MESATSHAERHGPSAIAQRIGPVFSAGDLAEWLTPQRSIDQIQSEAEQRLLVALKTSDGQWAFPEWAFEREPGRLSLRSDVVALWRVLPHDGFLTAADLAAWMSTRFEALGRATPAMRVIEHGMNDRPLQTAVARLRTRVN